MTVLQPPPASVDDDSEADVRQPPTDRIVVLTTMALTAVIGGYRLGAPSLWFDETFSIIVADGDLSHLFRMAAETEASGALYYWLLGSWLTFGTGEAAMRSLSLLLAVLTIPVFHALGRRLVDPLTARVATVLLALNAMFLTYARELRGYSLVLLLVTVSTYALVRAVREERTGWWALWAVAGALSAYAHLFGALVVGSHVLAFGSLLRDRSQWRRGFVWTSVVGVLLVPMAAFLLANSGEQVDWIPALGLGSFAWLARELAGVPGEGAIGTLLVLPVAVFVLIGLYRMALQWRANPRDEAAQGPLIILSWLMVPVVAAAAVSVLIQPLFIPRYFIVILPAFALVAAAGITSLRERPFAVPIAVVVVVALGIPTVALRYDDSGRQDWRRAIALVAEGWQEGDVIVLTPGYYLTAVDHYVAEQMPREVRPVRVYGDDELGVYGGRADVVDYRVGPAVEVEADRVWYVTTPGRAATLGEPEAGELVGFDQLPSWSAEGTWELGGLVVRLLAPVAAQEAAA
jgi:mannosyltransferase